MLVRAAVEATPLDPKFCVHCLALPLIGGANAKLRCKVSRVLEGRTLRVWNPGGFLPELMAVFARVQEG